MHISGGRLRRIIVGFVAIAAVVVAVEPPIASGEVAVPVVSINPDWTFVVSETYRDCDGAEYDVGTFGAVILERTEVDGDVAGFEVPVTYGGSLAGSLVDPQPAAVFEEPEWPEAEIYIELPESTPGTLTITLDAPAVDAGYELGPDPEDTTIELTVPGEESRVDCADPIGIDEENNSQVIRVGETPDPLGIFDFDFECDPEDECDFEECEGDCEFASTTVVASELSRARATEDDVFDDIWDIYSTIVVGPLPPGLAYADDEWTGTATTPGTYAFDVRLCIDRGFVIDSEPLSADARVAVSRARAIEDLPETLCFGTEPVRVEVLAAAADNDTTSPPATPIRTRARFTG